MVYPLLLLWITKNISTDWSHPPKVPNDRNAAILGGWGGGNACRVFSGPNSSCRFIYMVLFCADYGLRQC